MKYCYCWNLQRLSCWKMYSTTFQDVLKVEKWAKQKWVLFFETPCTVHKIYDKNNCSTTQIEYAMHLGLLQRLSFSQFSIFFSECVKIFYCFYQFLRKLQSKYFFIITLYCISTNEFILTHLSISMILTKRAIDNGLPPSKILLFLLWT